MRSLPLNWTAELLMKLLPLTVSVKAASPTKALVEERLVIVGAGLLTEKLKAVEVPPPGAGLTTTTGITPAVLMSAAVISAVNCVLLPKWVSRSLLLKRTTEPLTKPEPFTVRMKAELPKIVFAGARLLIVGRGLSTATFSALEVPPPGAGEKTEIARE